MKPAALALLLLSCSTSSPAPRELEPASAPAPHCRAYCAAVLRCAPDFYYVECPADCAELVSDPQRSAVSGLTAAVVRCWATAPSCDRAIECDAQAKP